MELSIQDLIDRVYVRGVEASPKQRITAECGRRGRRQVVSECVSILSGDDPDPELLEVLGGPPAQRLLVAVSRADIDLWLRVWAVRGLLWALDSQTVRQASSAIVQALHDPGWRVREKAAQVVARHLIDDALEGVADLQQRDPVKRVRAAAERAVSRLTDVSDAAPERRTRAR